MKIFLILFFALILFALQNRDRQHLFITLTKEKCKIVEINCTSKVSIHLCSGVEGHLIYQTNTKALGSTNLYNLDP